jgi:hypothetical protein
MAEKTAAVPVSELTKILDARQRKAHRFDVSGFFGLGGKAIPEVAFLVPTKAEEDGAVVAAHQHARERAGTDEMARHDPDILCDAKIVEVLFRTCKVPVEDPGAIPYPAFSGGPQWMRKHLTSDQLACLHNLLTEVKRSESPLRSELDHETVEAVARGCWAARHTEIPEAVLADCSREWLTQAFTLLAMRLADLLGWGAPTPVEAEPPAAEPQD